MNWSDYKNFSKWEFDCKHTGENKMVPEFIDILQQIRNTFGKPMVISSGYRHWTHPVEIHKDNPGEHTYGMAADIKVHGTWAMDLLVIAYGYGIKRIGVQQYGDVDKRYIHIGMGDKLLNFPPALWSY